jgi:hypothetical protein
MEVEHEGEVIAVAQQRLGCDRAAAAMFCDGVARDLQAEVRQGSLALLPPIEYDEHSDGKATSRNKPSPAWNAP